MKIGDVVHWFVTDKCNIDCIYCFKPILDSSEVLSRIEELTQILVSNHVKKVIIGGGEPLIVKGLEKVLEQLKQENVYVSLHTNGLGLDDNRIAQLSGLVDDIALPIDSVNESIQKHLRGEKFLAVFDNFSGLVDKIQAQGIKIGYHTVFTAINYQEVPEIYDFISQKPFDYWRIYEFNFELPFQNFLLKYNEKKATPKIIEKYEQLTRLAGKGSPEKGYTDTLFANFILMEEQMKKNNDKRIQFVGIRDFSKPVYVFLDNSGDIRFYSWFSDRARRVIGNILTEGFSVVRSKLEEQAEKGWTYDGKGEDEFINAKCNRELWARYYEGAFDIEEIEMIQPEYLDKFYHLVDLFNKREQKQEK
ncbi:MAG: radical SAM protein [Nanoarchaeota archaeon]|nr:radical SAM protein [Nanoarchaeota archaeon]MBU1321790.1 radical SAM protein [Nanoarchaeota archaeon]MBU1598196.1 radical SAM protein [Nanoarchaeota archaeon]MBU2441665.1 radical SAM protein [Nanoarchaeota archaeon]